MLHQILHNIANISKLPESKNKKIAQIVRPCRYSRIKGTISNLVALVL